MTKKIVSILLVFALAISLFAGSALAAAGDQSGDFNDFPFISLSSAGNFYVSPVGTTNRIVECYSGAGSNHPLPVVAFLPASISSSDASFTVSSSSIVYASFVPSYAYVGFYDTDGVEILFDSNGDSISASLKLDKSHSVPVGTRFILIYLASSPSAGSRVNFSLNGITYTNFVYSSSSAGGSGGSDYDPSLDEDILSGVEAIARSLLDLETGPYSSTSGVSLNSDGVVTPTTRNDATLETLLNLIGVSSTYSSLAIEQMNLNFGNYFEYHEIEDTSSGTVTVVKNLPSYVNALGMELTDGINKLQRDNLMIYQQGEDLEDALYTDKAENQPWSVAQWLKDIYTAITSFFSSFWSPAETALKTAAEDGMQAASDNGNAASGSQVDEVNSAADAFKSFGSTGNIGSGDVMDIFSDGASYDFFSQTTKDNLAYHPPAGGRRNLRSSSAPVESDQSEEEYVDELDDKLSYWREVLGLP